MITIGMKVHAPVVCLVLSVAIASWAAPLDTAVAAQKTPSLVAQEGHREAITSVAFAPGGRLLASASRDSTIKIWEIDTRRLMRTLRGHRGSVNAVAFSSDGAILVSGSDDKTAKVWKVQTGAVLKDLPGHRAAVNSVAFSPDGVWIATGSGDCTARVWNIATGEVVRDFGKHEGPVNSVAFSKDGKLLATGSDDKTIKIWNLETRASQDLTGHKERVRSVAFSPTDSGLLVSGGEDKNVRKWRLSPTSKWTVIDNLPDVVTSVAFSPNGELLAAASYERGIQIWDVGSGVRRPSLDKKSGWFQTIAFSHDGKLLASGGDGKEVLLWDVSQSDISGLLKTLSHPVSYAEFTKEGERFASAGADNSIRFWNFKTGRLERNLTIESVAGGVAMTTWDISPRDSVMAVGGTDGLVRLHSVKDGRELFNLSVGAEATAEKEISSLAFSPTEPKLGASCGQKITLLNLATRDIERSFENDSHKVRCLSFSSDGLLLASGGWDNTVRIWDVDEGKELHKFKVGALISSVVFRPGTPEVLVACSDDGSVRRWDARDGKPLTALAGDKDGVKAVAVMRDGFKMATGGDDGTIAIWNLKSSQRLLHWSAHEGAVLSVAFSPENKTLLSAGDDASIKMWRAETGELVLTLRSFGDSDDYVAYTPHGYFVGSETGQRLALWEIGGAVYAFEQYVNVLNYPDRVAKTIAGDSVPTPDIDIMTDTPPSISWVVDDSTTASGNYSCFDIHYQGAGALDYLNFERNGQSDNLDENRGSVDVTLRHVVERRLSKDFFCAVAKDQNKLTSNRLWRGDLEPPGSIKGGQSRAAPEFTKAQKRIAVIIGISDYANLGKQEGKNTKLTDLAYAHLDALDMKKFLENKALSGGDWQIKTLINEQATQANIDSVLVEALQFADREDLICIFFSGHGLSHPYREQDLFLLPYDWNPRNIRSAYDFDWLYKLVDDSRAEHIIMFIDCCRSGMVGHAKGTGGVIDQDLIMERLATLPANKITITSTTGKGQANEDPVLKHGVFTYYLLKGLRGEAENEDEDNFVDIGELYEYVRREVSDHTRKSVSPQIPEMKEVRDVLELDTPVALRPQRLATK